MRKIIKKENIIYVLLLIISIIIVSIPAFSKYNFIADDYLQHTARIDGVVDAIKNRIFFYHMNGYSNYYWGSADPIGYPSKFLIIPAILITIGVPQAVSINIFIIIVNILCAIVMYFSVESIYQDKKVAFLASMIYVLLLYRVMNIYSRLAIGEFLGEIFLPIYVCGMYHILYGNHKKWYILVIGLAGLLHSHLISIFYVMMTLFIVILVNIKCFLCDKERMKSLILCAIFTLLLTLCFIIPFIDYYLNEDLIMFDRSKTKIMYETPDILDGNVFSYFISIFTYPFRNFVFNIGYVDNGTLNCMTTIIDFVFIVILFLRLYLFIRKKIIKKEDDNNIFYETKDDNIKKFNILLVILVVFCYLEATGLCTKGYLGNIEIIKKIFSMQQFDFRPLNRMYAYAIILFSFYIFNLKIIKSNLLRYIIYICIFVVMSISTLSLLKNYPGEDARRTIGWDGHHSFEDYMLQGTVYHPTENNFKITVNDKKILTNDFKRSYMNVSCSYIYNNAQMLPNKIIEFPIFAYRYVKAFDANGKEMKINRGDNNKVAVAINTKKGRINVKFVVPILWKILDIIYYITLVFFICVIIINRKQRKLDNNDI